MKQNSAVSVYIGIASLVLEGRVISTDEDDDDAFSKKFESNVVQLQLRNEGAIGNSSSSSSSTSRHGVIHRISEKLMRLRQFPGSNKEVVESLAIPIQSSDDCDYERPRLHHVASAREFQRSARFTALPASSVSNSSSAASVLHDIDVDWNDISILFNGLDSLVNLPGSPIKMSATHSFRASLAGHHPVPMNQEPSVKILKGQEKGASKTTSKPKQGPHCEKFLKKIGILKIESGEQEGDHMCNHVSGYVSIQFTTCIKNVSKDNFFSVSSLATSFEKDAANFV